MSAEQHSIDSPYWQYYSDTALSSDFDAALELDAIEDNSCHAMHYNPELFAALLRSCRETDDGHHSSIREVQMANSQFLVEHTHSHAALDAIDKPRIICLPGITQRMNGSEHKIHDNISRDFPDSVVTTLGSNAIGIRGAHDKATLEQAAMDRFEYLVETTPYGQPIIIAATSMGAVITNNMLNLNIDESEPLNIQGATYLVPAIVPPEEKGFTSEPNFLYKLGSSSLKTLFRHNITEQARILWGFRGLVVDSVQQIQPILHQAIELRGGTPISKIESVLGHYCIRVVIAEDDSLAQQIMWRNFSSRFPNLTVTELANTGHDIAYHPEPASSIYRNEIGYLLDKK